MADTPKERVTGGHLVPKQDLVGVLQVLLQGKRIRVSQELALSAMLLEELHQFRMKAVPLTDDVIEWRERPHDDLVLAVAVAACQGSGRPGSCSQCSIRTRRSWSIRGGGEGSRGAWSRGWNDSATALTCGATPLTVVVLPARPESGGTGHPTSQPHSGRGIGSEGPPRQ
jgi:hypothetical protein